MDLLSPVATRYTPQGQAAHDFSDSSDPGRAHAASPITSSDTAYEVLKSRPSWEQLLELLSWLDRSSNTKEGFDVHAPGPKSTQIIYALINNVVPDYWEHLSSSSSSVGGKARRSLIRCLRSTAAIGAILSRLRFLLDQNKSLDQAKGTVLVNKKTPFEQLVQLLEAILQKDEVTAQLWMRIHSFRLSSVQESLQWKETVSILASGRLISVLSETNQAINGLSSDLERSSWLGDGKLYAAWLGRSIQHMLKESKDGSKLGVIAGAAHLLGKSLKLGYDDTVVEAAFFDLLSGKEYAEVYCKACLSQLSKRDQQATLYACIKILKNRFTTSTGVQNQESRNTSDQKFLGGFSALIERLTSSDEILEDSLVSWLTTVSADSSAHSFIAHRAVALAISSSIRQLRHAFEKMLQMFGDKTFIKHTPILQQEVHTQTSLLLVGHLYRSDEPYLVAKTKSSTYLNAISNRLAASSEKSRFQGMIVGTLVSGLVDPTDRQMKFSLVDPDADDVQRYRDLVYSKDKISSIKDLADGVGLPKRHDEEVPSARINPAPMPRTKAGTGLGSKIVSIEEVSSGSESEDDDLPVYAKGGPDPSDSDDDPTLVRRDKPTAPVYIQDLIKGLRDLEDYDRNRLALTNAAVLIRRKAAFGTEVTDNAIEIASILVGLNDKWEMEDFQPSRLRGMIAILIANPKQIGPWFAETFYNGEYSISQRAIILTAIGLGAREIAGLGKEDAHMTDSSNPTAAFPSQKLPEILHSHYSIPEGQPVRALAVTSSTFLEPAASKRAAEPLLSLSTSVTNSLIRPLAAQAADNLSGPTALKIRTFSSRLAVESKRPKPGPNALAAIAADSFIFPLIGRWQVHLRSYGGLAAATNPGAATGTTVTSPFLLSTLLRTFALLLHAAGPTLANLPRITEELWTLFLDVRALAEQGGKRVLEGLLFALLTLLEVNMAGTSSSSEAGGRRLAEENAKQLLETREWVEGVLDRYGTSGRSGISIASPSASSSKSGAGKGKGKGKSNLDETTGKDKGINEPEDEDERVSLLAAAVLMRCREVVERYQRLLMGDLVGFI